MYICEGVGSSNFSDTELRWTISKYPFLVALLNAAGDVDLVLSEEDVASFDEVVTEFPEQKPQLDLLKSELPMRRAYYKLELEKSRAAAAATLIPFRVPFTDGGGGGTPQLPRLDIQVGELTMASSSIREIVEFNNDLDYSAIPHTWLKAKLDEYIKRIIDIEKYLDVEKDSFSKITTLEMTLKFFDARDGVVTDDIHPKISQHAVQELKLELLKELSKYIPEESDENDNDEISDEVDDENESSSGALQFTEDFLRRVADTKKYLSEKPKRSVRCIELTHHIGDNDGVPAPRIEFNLSSQCTAESLKSFRGMSARAYEIAEEVNKHLKLFAEMLLKILDQLARSSPVMQTIVHEWGKIDLKTKAEYGSDIERRCFIRPLPRMLVDRIEKHLQGEKTNAELSEENLEILVSLNPFDFKNEAEFALKFTTQLSMLDRLKNPYYNPVERFLRCYKLSAGKSPDTARGNEVRAVSTILHETHASLRRTTKEEITLQFMIDLAGRNSRQTDQPGGQRGKGQGKNNKRNNAASSSTSNSNPNPPNATAFVAVSPPVSSPKGGFTGKAKGGGKGKGKGKGGKEYFRNNGLHDRGTWRTT